MAEKTDVAVAAGRSHIIERPRLTRLLDESTSRVILLVAPAGYGKTTLARQWLENRPHAWYRGTPASADVAALVRGLATELASVVPGTGQRVDQRLRLTAEPERDVALLAELLAADLDEWPGDAWLVLDEYHLVTESKISETFVDLLLTQTSLSVIIATRRRPRWATARRILYGDFFEIGRSMLAMSPSEAAAVLAHRRTTIPGLQALAEGWPAVIGLAALTNDPMLPDADLPRPLYEFFAEELLADLRESTRSYLCQLAISPTISRDLIRVVCGAFAEDVLSEASRVGILGVNAVGDIELHPLVHEFLRSRVAKLPTHVGSTAVATISRWLIANGEWDDAFAVASRFHSDHLIIPLIEAAFPQLLREGRLPTLRRWLDAARNGSLSSPLLEVVDAELRFRAGSFGEAEQIALHAAESAADGPDVKFQALHLAGASAYQRDEFNRAFEFHRQALEVGRSRAAVRKATWGQFLSAVQLEMLDEANRLLGDLRSLSDGSADARIQLATGKLLIAGRGEGFSQETLAEARGVLGLIPHSTDPKISSSFIHLTANALATAAYYDEALQLIYRALADVRRYRLDFALPFSNLIAANAYFGLRRFREANGFLDECENAARSAEDRYVLLTARALRARLLVSIGAYEEAVATTAEEPPRIPTQAIYGEYLASRALALACAGDGTGALRIAEQAAEMTRGIEARALAAATRAVVALGNAQTPDTEVIRQAFRTALNLGSNDAFVAAFRGRPPLVRVIGEDARLAGPAREILDRSRDLDLARFAGFDVRQSNRARGGLALSPREGEVHQLLAEGLSNREIARAMFISEPTVKVHVRRILQKLGVRSRTQAALRYAPDERD